MKINGLSKFLDSMSPMGTTLMLDHLAPETIAHLAIAAYRACAEEVELALQAGQQSRFHESASA